MMDATADDLIVVDEYVKQGFTREEALLTVFEDKYGKVKGQGGVNKALVSSFCL